LNFLDIGAGDGRLTSLLLSYDKSSHGTAIEVRTKLDIWQSILDSNVGRLVQLDGLLQEHLKQLSDFNFIILSEVFEHIPLNDVPNFLTDLNRVTKKGGYVYLTTPNRKVQGPAEDSPLWHEIEPYGHYKHYTLHELKTLLMSASFEIVETNFECNIRKLNLFNKWYYPIARFDGRILDSKKIPNWIKSIYKIITIPLTEIIKIIFKSLGNLVYKIEKNENNENNASTIIILAKKISIK
jgi:SAM-dependent methyltransferase